MIDRILNFKFLEEHLGGITLTCQYKHTIGKDERGSLGRDEDLVGLSSTLLMLRR